MSKWHPIAWCLRACDVYACITSCVQFLPAHQKRCVCVEFWHESHPILPWLCTHPHTPRALPWLCTHTHTHTQSTTMVMYTHPHTPMVMYTHRALPWLCTHTHTPRALPWLCTHPPHTPRALPWLHVCTHPTHTQHTTMAMYTSSHTPRAWRHTYEYNQVQVLSWVRW